VVEESRPLTVTLLPSDEYRLYEATTTITVQDNEPTITFAGIAPGSEAKPDADAPADATTPIKLGFTMDRPPTRAVTLDLTIADGTAHAGEDYTPLTVSIPPSTHGETGAAIDLPVLGGTVKEWTETFNVTLNQSTQYRLPKTPADVTIPQGPITGYIQDNDGVDLVLNNMGEATEETPGLITGVGGDLIPLTLAMPKYASGTEVKLSVTGASAVEVYNNTEGTGTPIIAGTDTYEVLQGTGDVLQLAVRAVAAAVATFDLRATDAATKPVKSNSSDTATLTAFSVDLDIDSENNDGFATPSRSNEEDDAEDLSNTPGKVIYANNQDIDDDGIPDLADLHVSPAASDSTLTGNFVPMVIAISDFVDLADVKLTFAYDASDPSSVTVNAASTLLVREPFASGLRRGLSLGLPTRS
jgi:hypothetical protein